MGFFSVLCCQKYLFSEDEICEVQVNIATLGHAGGVCQLYDLCRSSGIEYYCSLYGGAHTFLLLRKQQQILQFRQVVVPCSAVVFLPSSFCEKGEKN